MNIKPIAERKIITRSLSTGEEKSFIFKVGMPEHIGPNGGACCHLDFGWLGAELAPLVLASISQVRGIDTLDALRGALQIEEHLSLFTDKYILSCCYKDSSFYPKNEASLFINISDVVKITGSAKSTIYSWVKSGFFPKPIATGPNSSRFRLHEVRAWCADPVKWREECVLSVICEGDECPYEK